MVRISILVYVLSANDKTTLNLEAKTSPLSSLARTINYNNERAASPSPAGTIHRSIRQKDRLFSNLQNGHAEASSRPSIITINIA